MGYDFAKTVGFPEKSKDFLGRGGTTARVSFRACTEMSDTKFVTTRAKQRCGETPGQGQKNDIQADRRKQERKCVHNSNEHRILIPKIHPQPKGVWTNSGETPLNTPLQSQKRKNGDDIF